MKPTLLLLMALLSGCARVPHDASTLITSEPAGARVSCDWRGGIILGWTPCRVVIPGSEFGTTFLSVEPVGVGHPWTVYFEGLNRPHRIFFPLYEDQPRFGGGGNPAENINLNVTGP